MKLVSRRSHIRLIAYLVVLCTGNNLRIVEDENE